MLVSFLTVKNRRSFGLLRRMCSTTRHSVASHDAPVSHSSILHLLRSYVAPPVRANLKVQTFLSDLHSCQHIQCSTLPIETWTSVLTWATLRNTISSSHLHFIHHFYLQFQFFYEAAILLNILHNPKEKRSLCHVLLAPMADNSPEGRLWGRGQFVFGRGGGVRWATLRGSPGPVRDVTLPGLSDSLPARKENQAVNRNNEKIGWLFWNPQKTNIHDCLFFHSTVIHYYLQGNLIAQSRTSNIYIHSFLVLRWYSFPFLTEHLHKSN